MISTKKENPAFSLPGSRAPQIVKITELVFLDWGMRLLSISLVPMLHARWSRLYNIKQQPNSKNCLSLTFFNILFI